MFLVNIDSGSRCFRLIQLFPIKSQLVKLFAEIRDPIRDPSNISRDPLSELYANCLTLKPIGYESTKQIIYSLFNASRSSISNTCLGQNKTCKRFYWSYNLTEPFVIEGDLRKKEVVQYDLEGNQILNYESVAEASSISGISKTCISRCCRGERKLSAGFKWSYE